MKDDLLPNEEEEIFGEYFRRHLAMNHPNPNRIGCPDSRIIRDLAFRRQVAPETVHKVTSHMFKCSECVRDALDYVEEYRKTTE